MNLIIFDIDDTLTKSSVQHHSAYISAMQEFGITEIDQNWSKYEHHTDSYILKINYENNLNKKFELSLIHDFENRMNKLILSLEGISEVKGAKHFINFLSKKGDYGFAFATGSLLKPAFYKLKQVGIKYNEALVVGANEIYDREGIVTASIERAKIFYNVESFENIISIGDGIWDLKTAKNLGIHFIGIGMKNFAEFKAENIKVHIKNWCDFDLSDAEEKLGIKNHVGNSTKVSMKQKWEIYNPDWLVKLAKEQIPDRLDIIEALKMCVKVQRESKAYVYFVSRVNPNQPNSDWQFKESVILEDEKVGTIILDILQDGRIGGVEFYKYI